MPYRVCLLGGGSGFFNSVLREIALTPELNGSEITLCDLVPEAMELIAGVGRLVSDKAGAGLSIRTTTSLDAATEGADFAVSSLGVHGPGKKWHKLDMDVAARFGIIQTTGDTVGPGGLSIALRLIPAYVRIARTLAKNSPDCVLLNHSNPMGAICRAIAKYTDVRQVVGLCHGVQGTYKYLAGVFGVPYEEVYARSAGLNHLLWLQEFRHDQEDLVPLLREKLDGHRGDRGRRFAWRLYEVFGHFPINEDRHIIEFFPYLRQCSKPEDLPYGLGFRGDGLARGEDSDRGWTEEMRRKLEGKEEVELPDHPSPENIGQLIASMALPRREVRIVNIQNDGCIPNMPAFANLEFEGVTGYRRVDGLKMQPVPDCVVGPMAARIRQVELLVDAAVEGNRSKALQALAQDPMILSLREAEELLSATIEAHGERLAHLK